MLKEHKEDSEEVVGDEEDVPVSSGYSCEQYFEFHFAMVEVFINNQQTYSCNGL